MKKVLLVAVNAKYIHSNPAVYSLKAYAEKKAEAKTQIQIAEYTINQQQTFLLEDIYKRKPDLLAFSCYIWNWKMIRELLPEIIKLLPDTAVWLGGPEVSFEAEERMREYAMLTGIMIGEGEATFRELVSYYADSAKHGSYADNTVDYENDGRKRGALGEIAGIVYREGERIYRNSERNLLSIDELPFSYGEPESFRNRVIYYESSRGCPFRCSYCLSGIDKQVRLKSAEKVTKELDWFLGHNVPQVKFIDRTFNCNHEHALSIWRYIKDHDNGITNFHFEIGGDLLTEEEIQLLSTLRPGLVQLEIGVQTTNRKTLDEICRKTDQDKLRQNIIRLSSGHNIHLHLDLIAGLPFEDLESFIRSFNEVYDLKPDQLQLGFLKVLKGSSMKEKAADYNLKSMDTPPYEVLSTKWLPYSDQCLLKRVEEIVEIYYNSGQFLNTLAVMERLFETPFDMYEALAAYYEHQGYLMNSPSRIYRYTILLEFAEQVEEHVMRERLKLTKGQTGMLFRQLLTYDLYLRENSKSRPEFAGELPKQEKERKAFYESEERIARYLPGYVQLQPRQIARMTHMEFFTYRVFAEDAMDKTFTEPGGAPYCIIFDYRQIDPLTKNAIIKQII